MNKSIIELINKYNKSLLTNEYNNHKLYLIKNDEQTFSYTIIENHKTIKSGIINKNDIEKLTLNKYTRLFLGDKLVEYDFN